jgi:hypothetical protein
MDRVIDVVVGSLIYRQGAYVIDKFLANQKEIQREYPSAELVLATNEGDFIQELERLLSHWGLRGRIILYETVKPEYARSKVWNIACGREAIRRYTLSQPEVRYLLSLDADMICDADVIKKMEKKIQGYDVVFNGCAIRGLGIGLAGGGCMMLTRDTLEKIKFRCIEFKNGEVIFEDNLLEMDSFKLGIRIKKGFFIHTSHYKNENEARHVVSHSVGIYQRVTSSALIRYIFIRASLIVRCNILWRLKVFADRLRGDVW